MTTFEQLYKNWCGFVKNTFRESTPSHSLKHAKREIKELQNDISSNAPRDQTIEEYADVILCVLTSAAAYGLQYYDLLHAIDKKIYKNENREWKYNGDGTYSHIKKGIEAQKPELLTIQERDVFEETADLWNDFLSLPQLYDQERQEFMFHIHSLQSIIMSRPVQREQMDK